MRISFIYSNRNQYLCPAPIGALHVTSRLARDGHDVQFIDLMHEKDPLRTLEKLLSSHNPELVCMSIRNVDNQQMFELSQPLPEIASFAQAIRRVTAAPLLIGGTAVTTFPRQIREMMNADWAFAGDDVALISRFIDSVAKGAPELSIPGITWRDGDGDHRNAAVITGYADAHFEGLERIDLKKYRKGFYDCGVLTCSGCPHGCSFCDAHKSFGRTHIPRDPAIVVEELIALEKKHSARSVFLVNNGINYPLEHGKELMRRLIEARLKLSFACIIEPGPFDAEMANLLYRANCNTAMVFGTSLNDAVLERNQPHYRAADIQRIARHLADAKVPWMLGTMFGGMGETIPGVQASLELANALKPSMLITGVGFRIQDDTPLKTEAIRLGQIPADSDCFEPVFFIPENAPPQEIRKTVKRFMRTHPMVTLRMGGFILQSMREGIFGRAGRFDR